MLCRLTTLLVMGFVLLGAISPALACAAAERDCCPAGTTTPCGGEGSGYDSNDVVAACCVNTPKTSSAWIAASRDPLEGQNHSGSSDPIVAIAWLATFAPLPHASHLPTRTAIATHGDGVLTYLRTGRLRL